MSILIKGIDMPKECEGIELVFIPKDEDIIYNRSESMSIGADRIIEIPTPHGRLVDWDLFNSKLDIQYAEGRGKALAPTILEEEK